MSTKLYDLFAIHVVVPNGDTAFFEHLSDWRDDGTTLLQWASAGCISTGDSTKIRHEWEARFGEPLSLREPQLYTVIGTFNGAPCQPFEVEALTVKEAEQAFYDHWKGIYENDNPWTKSCHVPNRTVVAVISGKVQVAK